MLISINKPIHVWVNFAQCNDINVCVCVCACACACVFVLNLQEFERVSLLTLASLISLHHLLVSLYEYIFMNRMV